MRAQYVTNVEFGWRAQFDHGLTTTATEGPKALQLTSGRRRRLFWLSTVETYCSFTYLSVEDTILHINVASILDVQMASV